MQLTAIHVPIKIARLYLLSIRRVGDLRKASNQALKWVWEGWVGERWQSGGHVEEAVCRVGAMPAKRGFKSGITGMPLSANFLNSKETKWEGEGGSVSVMLTS